MASLNADAFKLLLERLDPDLTLAAEKYELLRLKLTRCLRRRNCSESDIDEVADDTIDRVIAKLVEGTEILNVEAYACTAMRYVWLEYLRKDGKTVRTGEVPEVIVEPEFPDDPDIRLACLRSCLIEIAPESNDRKLILGYYNAEIEKKIKQQRKSLAESLGLTMNTLKVKAFRLRARLEKCINECVEKRLHFVTK